jgi:hypothetical protein
VRGYPTIKFFPAGRKDDSSAVDYDGQRTASALAEWAREKTKDLKHWEHIRLGSQSEYDELCAGRSKRLVIKTSVLLPSCRTSWTAASKREMPSLKLSRKLALSSEASRISFYGRKEGITSISRRNWEQLESATRSLP